MVKVIQETCHAKEIEHFRLLGSYFGNAIKQKKNLSWLHFFKTAKQVAVVLYYGCVVVCEQNGRRAINLVVIDWSFCILSAI